MSEMIVSEFLAYCADIRRNAVSDADWSDKMRATLGRLVDATVRQASSALVPIDLDLCAISDGKLADRMQMHVQSRSGGLQVATNTRLPNSAWCMMLEAAKRLRSLPNWGPPRPMAEAPRDGTHILVRDVGCCSDGRGPCVVMWWRADPGIWLSPARGGLEPHYFEHTLLGWWPLPEQTP